MNLEPSLDAGPTEDHGTWSVRSALFHDRSRSQREDSAAKLLARACMPVKGSFSPRGSVGSNTMDSNVSAQAAIRGRIPCAS